MSIVSASGNGTTTASFVIPLGTGVEMGDTFIYSGATGLSPSSTGTLSPAIVANISLGTNATLTVTMPTTTTGSYSGGGAAKLTIAYLKGSGSTLPRYDLKLVTQMSGSWSSAPTIIDLTTSMVRSGFGWGDCSVGNPDGFVSPGGTYYISFLVQDSTNSCTSGSTAGDSPGMGTYYDLWACNLPIPFTAANMTSANCAMLLSSNQSTTGAGAFLDPHIWHNGHVYASERCYTSLPAPACILASGGWPQWGLDDVPVSWGGSGTPPSITGGTAAVNRYQFGGWTTAERSNVCEQFYKLTSLGDLPNGNVRGFFNANQVGNSYTAMTGACASLGANNFYQDGIFYGDFNGALPGGANFTQIYPPYHMANQAFPATANCVTPGKNVQCYSEFPYVFHDMRRMVFVGSLFTQSWVIDQCAVTSGCTANYNNDEIQALLAVDYTHSTFPMSVVEMTRRTNYNMLGSPTCEQFFSLGGASTTCGIAAGYYGDCSHLSVNEPTQLLACDMNTTATGSSTVVTPLASTPASPFLSILYPGASLLGGVQSQ